MSPAKTSPAFFASWQEAFGWEKNCLPLASWGHLLYVGVSEGASFPQPFPRLQDGHGAFFTVLVVEAPASSLETLWFQFHPELNAPIETPKSQTPTILVPTETSAMPEISALSEIPVTAQKPEAFENSEFTSTAAVTAVIQPGTSISQSILEQIEKTALHQAAPIQMAPTDFELIDLEPSSIENEGDGKEENRSELETENSAETEENFSPLNSSAPPIGIDLANLFSRPAAPSPELPPTAETKPVIAKKPSLVPPVPPRSPVSAPVRAAQVQNNLASQPPPPPMPDLILIQAEVLPAKVPQQNILNENELQAVKTQFQDVFLFAVDQDHAQLVQSSRAIQLDPLDLRKPSPFRIATRTEKPFFGPVTPNEFNDGFFIGITGGNYPPVFSVIPIFQNDRISHLLAAYSFEDQGLQALKTLEDIASHIQFAA